MIRKIAIAVMLLAFAPALAHAQDAPSAAPTAMMLPRLPMVTVQPMPGYGTAPMVVGFFLGSNDPSVQFRSYRWNFGDGEVSTLPPIALFHTYVNPGSYVVTVTATTTDGHQATGFAGIVVRPPSM